MAANLARIRHEAPAGGRRKAIYQVSKVFRQDELGPLHNPEFTMVEWYRVGDGMAEGMQFTSDLAEVMLGRGPAQRISYREAFLQYAGIDPLCADTTTLVTAVRKQGIEAPASLSSDDRDGWLDLLLVERVQPHLGQERPVLLYDYPASQAALSRIRQDDPPVAERFELYVSGIELANGYHELLDAEELRRRNRETNRLRERRRQNRVARGKPAAGGDGSGPAARGRRGAGLRPPGDAGRRGENPGRGDGVSL